MCFVLFFNKNFSKYFSGSTHITHVRGFVCHTIKHFYCKFLFTLTKYNMYKYEY